MGHARVRLSFRNAKGSFHSELNVPRAHYAVKASAGRGPPGVSLHRGPVDAGQFGHLASAGTAVLAVWPWFRTRGRLLSSRCRNSRGLLLVSVAVERLKVLRVEQTEHQGGNCAAGEVGDQKDPDGRP